MLCFQEITQIVTYEYSVKETKCVSGITPPY